jgi:hypothetical protein
MADRPLIYVSIRNSGGSIEHYYHFFLGYFLPLCAYLSQLKGPPPILLVPDCGPLGGHLNDLEVPGLVITNRRSHYNFIRRLNGEREFEQIEIRGVDIHRREQPVYDRAAVKRVVDQGSAYVRARLAASIARHRDRLVAEWVGSPRVLLLERVVPDPYYFSSLVDAKGGGSTRRTITNCDELAAALTETFGGITRAVLDHMSLAEQIAMFETADIVVGQHGAALANVVWMRPGSQVCEFIHKPDQELVFGDLSAICGLPHHFLEQREPKGPVDVREAVMRIAAVAGVASPAVDSATS